MNVVQVRQTFQHTLRDGADDRHVYRTVIAVDVVEAPARADKGKRVSVAYNVVRSPPQRTHPRFIYSMQMQMCGSAMKAP